MRSSTWSFSLNSALLHKFIIYDSKVTAYITDQINAFQSDSIVNESERYKVIISSKTLIIKDCKMINVGLLYTNLRLYNALFISYLNINLLSASQIISEDSYAVHNYKKYTAHR